MPETLDAFGRQRVSNPITLFDSKLIFDNQPLTWDDSEVSGADTTSTHSVNTASVVLGVAAATAGRRVRQTFMHFNYHPGKSREILMTGTLVTSGGGAGITSRFGYYEDNNGAFLQHKDGVTSFVIRTKTSGSVVDTVIPQSQWNVDRLDGTDNSLLTLDVTKSQLFVIDLEWLGVGRVRFGFIINGNIYYAHQNFSANILEGVYMSSPNLPLRYELINDGAGAASTMRQICSVVISEGGAEQTGPLFYGSTDGTHVDANTVDLLYALVGIRLKTTGLHCATRLKSVSVLAETNDDFEWIILHNPTVADTFTYGDYATNSCMQIARGATANTITGGERIDGGFADASQGIDGLIETAVHLGSAIDGTRDTIVLAARPLTANANIQGSLSWRELS